MRTVLEETHSTDRLWAISDDEGPPNMGWLLFMGWVISQANEWEDYSNYFGEGAEISRNWATIHFFFIFDGWPQNCCGAMSANVLQQAYSEAQGLLEVESSGMLVLVDSNQFLSCPMAMSFFQNDTWLYHSAPSLLFQ